MKGVPREKHAFFVFVPFQTPFLYYYLFCSRLLLTFVLHNHSDVAHCNLLVLHRNLLVLHRNSEFKLIACSMACSN